MKKKLFGAPTQGIIRMRFIYLIFTAMFFSSVHAQQNPSKISGKVTDSTGKAINGVSVNIKGTHIGTITDDNGIFHLKTSSTSVILIFSIVGYESKRNGGEWQRIKRIA